MRHKAPAMLVRSQGNAVEFKLMPSGGITPPQLVRL